MFLLVLQYCKPNLSWRLQKFFKMDQESDKDHCFQNRTGPGGRTVKTGNRDENRFFKPKEPDFLLIP